MLSRRSDARSQQCSHSPRIVSGVSFCRPSPPHFKLRRADFAQRKRTQLISPRILCARPMGDSCMGLASEAEVAGTVDVPKIGLTGAVGHATWNDSPVRGEPLSRLLAQNQP